MSKILVTGATGRLGHEVVQKLLARVEPSSLAVLVRDPSKAEDLRLQGVEIHTGDYDDFQSLLRAFQGVEKLFFVSASDFPKRLPQHENIVRAARETGISHIVYTSFQRKNETVESPMYFVSEAHLKTEQWLKESGITYTILKNGLYPDILPMYLGDKINDPHTIYVPAGEGKTAFALRSDLSSGSVEVLLGKGHENKVYEFSASHAWSFSEIADMLAEISGKKIIYVSPTLDEYKKALADNGVPEMYIHVLAGFAESIRQGEFDFPDNTLSSIISHDSFDLKLWLKEIYAQ